MRIGRGDRDRAMFTLGLVGKEGVDLGDCPVVCNDSEALVVHVEDQVLALIFESDSICDFYVTKHLP